jgi:exodeoxyribonuclease VII small subunit
MSETGEAELTFEKAIERLSEIVVSLEKGDMPLERTLALFEEGVVLSRVSASRLDHVEARVEQLLASQTTKPLDLDRAVDDRGAPRTGATKEPR